MISVNSAFDARLEEDVVGTLVSLVEVEGAGFTEFYTTANQELFATLSGQLREYKPLPGQASGNIQSATDLSVSTMEFTLAASAAANLLSLLPANNLDAATIRIYDVFADTPDLGRMAVYIGKIGDFGWNRTAVKAQGRNVWDSRFLEFPYYTYGDGCFWRFGSPGCGIDTSSYTIVVSPSRLAVSSCSRIGLWVNSLGTVPDGYYDFGRVTFTGGVNSGQIRAVRNHLGQSLQLSHALPYDPQSGDAMTLFPGCRKRFFADCTSKYNNARNYNGYQTIPIPEQIDVGE